MRVHEATTEKKGAGKPYERTQTGTRARRDPPPKHNFRVELKELIAIPNIAAKLKVPAKIDRRMGPNKNAWCEFHQANGHYIRNCLSLAHQLDELVKSGFLKDYLQEQQDDQVTAGADQGHEVPVHGEVNTISGGFSWGSMHCLPAKEVCARRAGGGGTASRPDPRCRPRLNKDRPLGCRAS